MAQNPWGVVSQEPLKNPWAIVSETSLEPPAEKDKPAEQPQPAILSPEEIGDPEAALIQGGRPVERPVSQASQAVVAPTEQQIGAGMEQQLRPWEPSVWERIQGMLPGDRAKAANEYAARQIAKERNIPVEEAYRQMKSAIGVSGAFGGRPSGQPMWNPEGRPEVQATTQAAPYLAEGLLNIPKGVAESALRAYRAGDIESSVDSGLIDKMITYLGDESKYIFIPNIPEKLGLDKKDPNYQSLVGLGNSLGYSLTTMVSSAVSASLAAPAGPVAQVAAGMGASGAVAYRASKDDFLNRLREKLNKDSKKVFGRPMTDEEWSDAKEKFNAEAVKYGAWEAIPEAISNAIFLKAFAAPAKSASGGKLSGIIEKSTSVASEHITETATGYGQNAQELKAGLTQNELTIVDAFKQQFIQTMLTMGVMAGGVKGVQAANQFYETQVLPRIDPASALAKAIRADLEFAGYSPAAFRMKSVTDAEKELLQQVPVKPVAVPEPSEEEWDLRPPEEEWIRLLGEKATLPDAQTTISARPEPTLDVESLPVDTKRKEPTLGPRQPAQPAPIVSPEMVPGMTEESEFEALPVPPEEEAVQEEVAPAPTQAAAALPESSAVAPVKQEKPVEEPKTETKITGQQTTEVPVDQLSISKEVPQFKIGANEKGVVEPLGGKFERVGVAPIQVWKRLDGSLEVISGRHRLDLAKRSGEKTIPAQIHDEASGFDASRAAILDAELNIRDGQGKVKDYVNYFKAAQLDRETADARGLLARATGKRAYAVATQGSDELIAAVRGDQIGDEAAYYIALNAPNDSKLQAVGIRAVMDGKSANAATNMMQAVKALAYENNTTTDMFGYDHSAEKEAQAMANIAARKQREMQTRLNAITGAVKNPKLAAEEGIDIKDPEAVRQRIIELRQRKAEWDNWSTNPELIAEIRAERGTAAPQLELRGETEQEIRQREATQEAERKAAEEKAIADREVDMFGLQPQVQEGEEAPTEDMFGAEGITQQPPKAPAPPTETGLFAAPKEEKKAEPKIGQVVKRIQLPDNMEARVFKTSDGYGASLYDKDSNNTVNGSVTRYKGEDALERATKKAEEIGKPKAPEESAEIKLARKELEESKKKPGEIIKGAKLRRRRLLLEHDKKREAAGKEPEVDVISELEKAGNEAVNNKPTKPDTPAKQRLVLMPCCDKKAAKAAPAMDLYKGVFFQTFANNVPAGADPNVVILSAKYGFISPDKVIEPYDQVMTDERAREMLSDLDKQLSEVKWPGDISDVLIVGGKEYQRVMRAAVAKLIEQGKISKDASVNVTKGGIGDQRSQLGAYLRDIPAQEESKETTTAEQRKNAQDNADDIGGEVVWMQGDYALVRGYSLLSGDPVYVGTKGSSRGRVDIESFTGDAIPADVKATMIAEKKRIEAEDKKKHEQKPFIVFDEGVALSEDIPPELAGVIREWKDLLKLNVPVYVSTIEDAKSNRNKFTGPHRRIGSGTLDANEAGSMRRMSDGSYYILFQKSAKPTKMLEVIAHEMGHLHQRVYYENASPVEKEALQAAHLKWLEGQKGKTAKELVEALRGRAVAKETRMPEGKSAEELSSYWKSFGEWYADQTSRWAVSAERPVTVVEKFFKRLGNQLRQFYQKLKNAKYLPDETFKEYIEKATERPANLESDQKGLLLNIEFPAKKSAAFQNAIAQQDRDDLISQLQSAKQELAAIPAKVARGESSIYLQKRANKLIGLARNLREQIDATKDRRDTPEDFLARAAKALADGQIEPSVYNVIKVAFEKEPSLLDGLLLSVKKGPEKSTAGSFAAFDRIVSLYTGTSGTTNPSTIRHELAHSLEQMMTGAQREAVIQKYTRELQKAIKSHPEDVYQNYFKAVLAFLEKPTKVNLQKAMRLVPSYDMYQYINPSEYWAVNAESLMASQLGGTWEKFKAAVRRLFEGLKSVFGFDNQYAIHKTFNDIMKGSRERLNYDVLADYVNKRIGEEVEVEPLILSNIQDDKDLLEKYKRPNTPMTDLTPVSTFVNNQWKNGKELYKEFVNDPKQAIADSGSAAARATLYLRNKNVFYGAGLESSDFARYNGALKTSEGLATASLALDNAIASGNIGIEVIFSGGLRYNPNAGRFVAEDRDQGMRGVYEAQYKLENRIGRQLATDIIQGYLEAKRSISIMNELYEREAAYEGVKQDLDAARAAGDKQEVARLKTMKSELERELEGIQSAVSSVNMSEEEMYEFAALEDKYSELRDIMDNWTATNQNLLRVWRQVGLLSEGRYQRLAAIKDYVPWNRIMNDEDDVHSPLQSTTRTMTNIGTEKLFRRGKPISVVDFVAKDGQQTFKVQPSSAVEVEVNGDIIPSNMVRGTPDGTIEVMVPIHEGDIVVIKTNREIENIIDNMTRNTMRMTMNAIRQFAAQRIVREYASRNHEGKIIQFKSPDKEKGRFTFIQNGRRTVVEISDPLLAEAIFGMEQIGLEMFKPLAMVANITRRAITLSGAFQVKQVFKDAPQAAFITGVKNPFALVGGAWKGFVTSLTNTDPVVDILRKAGIGGFHSPARTPEAEIKRRIGIMNRNVYQFTIKALDHIGDSSDMAQRVAIYKRVMAETGDEAQALYQAANVINFMRHGSSGVAQVLVRTVPFMGAYLNSTDVLMTTLIGGGLKGMSRKKALARLGITGSILATSTILYAMLAGGDPEYDELDDQTKLKNYIIPGTKIMLPANTGAAFIYKALPELIYNAFIEEATKDKYDARRVKVALSKAAADMLLGPEPVPSGIKQVAEVALDYNFFTGRPITPQRVAGLEKSEQYIGSTSELAKKLGNDVLSPIQIDHLLRGILGTTGAVIGWISNSIGAIANVRPEPEERETPIKGAFLRPDIPRGREDLFYDLRSETQTKYKTWQTMLNRGKDKEANEYIKKHGDVAFMNDYSEEVSKDLQEMGQLIDMAENFVDKNYTAAQRRKDITEYKRIKNEILDSVKDIRMEAFGKAKLLSDAEKKKYKKMLDDMMDRAKQVRQ